MGDIVLPVAAVLESPERFFEGSFSVGSDGRLGERAGAPPGAPSWFAFPGLRNAHVHLDLSGVRGVARARGGFGRWVLDLLRARGPFDPAVLQRGAALGAEEALRSGTTAVVDIDSSGAAASAVAASGLSGLSARELLGAGPAEPRLAEAARWLAAFETFAPGTLLGPALSPHAPYSTPEALYRGAAALAREQSVRLTTHVAETTAEAEFVRAGTGEFAELLRHLGAPAPFARAPGGTPVEYLDALGCAGERTLLAHCNYLGAGDLRRLAERGAPVAYCPRSHNFFGHPRHPVAELRAAGIRVGLGTDSRASNGSLSMLEELAYLRAARPDLPPSALFDMATRALAPWIDGGSGELRPGERADFVVAEAVGGIPRNLAQALEAVTSGEVRVVATVIAGVVCASAPGLAPDLLPLTRR